MEAKCRDLGVSLRPWQQGAARLILSKRADGRYATTVGGVGMSIPRQVGKTFMVGAIIFALCLLRPGLTVIWTAHRVRTAQETFKKMQGFARRARVAPFVDDIVRGSGSEAVLFRNGSRILFGARATGFGRGFDEVDIIVFDEAQILDEASLDDMIPAANQSRQETGALLLFMGTPPRPRDDGEVFTGMRSDALSGLDGDLAWVEFGADVGYEPTALPAPLSAEDLAQVAKANPSYPQDTPLEAILRMRKKLSPESFVREGLGLWDADTSLGIFSGWPQCRDPEVEVDPARVAAIGLGGDPDGLWGSIGGAQELEDGRVAVGVVDRREGQDWLVAEAERIQLQYGCDVVLDKGGPLAHLVKPLTDAGVRLVTYDGAQFSAACVQFWERIKGRQVVNPGHAALDAQIKAARWRYIGDRRAYGRKLGEVDLLEAVAMAAEVAHSSNYDVLDSVL